MSMALPFVFLFAEKLDTYLLNWREYKGNKYIIEY